MTPARAALASLLVTLGAAGAPAQTLDLGSMGGPDLGERSAFVGRAPYYERQADELFAITSAWRDTDDAISLAHDRALTNRVRAHARWLCARLLAGENARNAAADHRMVVGRLLSDAMRPLDERLDAFAETATIVHAGEATDEETASYARTRTALRAFLRRADQSFGTPDEPHPMGFTVRSLDRAMRPVVAELVALLTDDERAALARAWSDSTEAPTSDDGAPAALVRAERSLTHAPEARRLRRLASSALDAIGTVRAVDGELFARAEARTRAAAIALASPSRAGAERLLVRIIALGELLDALSLLREDADNNARADLDSLAEDAVRAVLNDGQRGSVVDDPLVGAFAVTARALRVAHDRRTLDEPRRMTGNTRRAWLLMHAEQGDREAALVSTLRDLVARPVRVTSPSVVSSIARTRTGYERLLAVRMSDDWLDELRQGGRLAVLLGPTISQRTRDLMLFTLRDRIAGAADRREREIAIDDLNLLRDRAERFGRTVLEDELASDGPEWLGETLGARLAQALAEARTAWVDAWVEDDATSRARWAGRLAILVRGRDLVFLAERLDDPALVARCALVPLCAMPEGASTPLRDRVRGLAGAAVRAALSDDPFTTDDDESTLTGIRVAEEGAGGAIALLDLALIARNDAPNLDDPFVRLIAQTGVVAPADHPARAHRHDIASYVRWLHELRHARSASDREAILAHLDAVGADVSARLSSD